jgi:hypothetical protein
MLVASTLYSNSSSVFLLYPSGLNDTNLGINFASLKLQSHIVDVDLSVKKQIYIDGRSGNLSSGCIFTALRALHIAGNIRYISHEFFVQLRSPLLPNFTFLRSFISGYNIPIILEGLSDG